MSCISSLDEVILHSGEILNVSMDFNEVLSDGITIDSANPTCSSSNVILTDTNDSLGFVYFTITCSVVGNYQIEVTVDLSNGERIIGSGTLKVRDR